MKSQLDLKLGKLRWAVKNPLCVEASTERRKADTMQKMQGCFHGQYIEICVQSHPEELEMGRMEKNTSDKRR